MVTARHCLAEIMRPDAMHYHMISILIAVVDHTMPIMVVEHDHAALIAERYRTSFSHQSTALGIVQTDVDRQPQKVLGRVTVRQDIAAWLYQHESYTLI